MRLDWRAITLGLSPEKWSALLSLMAALVVSVAAFFQWFTARGMFKTEIRTRVWVKVMFGVVTLMLLAAIVLLLAS